MKVKLAKPDVLLILEFENLNTFSDIADLLEVPRKILWKSVIESKEYTTFKIHKKNSNQYRNINKPSKNLSIIQKKLSYILNLKYNSSHKASHGFEKEKSIRTNAKCHLKRNLILNLDIKNYFSSINFARVRAMFMSYFKFNNEVATTLANICCDNNNVLPQGAATSPIISNIISYKLDKQLDRLAKRNGCIYTRYADDLTFSTNRGDFPSDIVTIEEEITTINEKLERIIRLNGFEINEKKTRLSDSSKAKYVTGVKINTKLNVDRAYIRRIRSILHTIEKNIENLDNALKIFNEKYPFRDTYFKNGDMFNVLRGMISHVGHIKGKQDELYKKFATRYNNLVGQINEKYKTGYPYIAIPLTFKEAREQWTFVIESESISYCLEGNIVGDIITGQGSAFLLRGIGLVTNWHVIKCYLEILEDGMFDFEEEYYIPIHKSRYSTEKWMAKINSYDVDRDFAVLEVKGIDTDRYGFNYSIEIVEDMDCSIIGYPDYRRGQGLHFEKGKTRGERNVSFGGPQYTRFSITMPIYGGNSGGPILNNSNEVIAIATKGRDNTITEVVPICDVIIALKDDIAIVVKGE